MSNVCYYTNSSGKDKADLGRLKSSKHYADNKINNSSILVICLIIF